MALSLAAAFAAADDRFCVTGESLAGVWKTYGRLHNETAGFDRWLEYAPHYERHLPRPFATTLPAAAAAAAAGTAPPPRPPVRMLEIGVQSGGSLC